VVVVFDGTSKQIFWDGASVAGPLAADVPLLDSSNVLIGSNLNAALGTTTAPTIGALDDVQFFSYPLAPSEIATLASGN
jgi:Concanavalin A-like lectin/glucanases superfamily